VPPYRGLTWDHPRGYTALAASGGALIAWDRQPLAGFETHPIADLCARYDLVVLDHPHVGEAVAQACLQPLEALFDAAEIAALEADSIGPSLASYRYAGRHWALPLDAASQVMAFRADLIDDAAPTLWSEVLALAEQVPIALSLAGPHAALSFQSIAAAFAATPADPAQFVDEDAGLVALDILARIAARMPVTAWPLNPIELLHRMATSDDIALCPLVYGYVNYATPTDPAAKPIAFADAPRGTAGGRPGSTLGGTGIGISTRCAVTPELLDHLRWLMGAEVQTRFIPQHDGQPSRRAAWADEAVNARWGGFYRATAATLEQAHLRPRHDGAIAFQTAASSMIRRALVDGTPHRALLDAMQAAYTASRAPNAER
jgi:multiple sugar transport system substrate-binding protein